jgi:hypothetical protein
MQVGEGAQFGAERAEGNPDLPDGTSGDQHRRRVKDVLAGRRDMHEIGCASLNRLGPVAELLHQGDHRVAATASGRCDGCGVQVAGFRDPGGHALDRLRHEAGAQQCADERNLDVDERLQPGGVTDDRRRLAGLSQRVEQSEIS